jgi:hypothetical protein
MNSNAFIAFGAVFLSTSVAAQTWIWGGPPAPLPENITAGICVPGTQLSLGIAVPPGGTVTDVNVSLTISHGRSGDVGFRVIHPGGLLVTLMDTIPFDASPLGATYSFDDEAAMTFDAAMIGAPGATPVPGGSYQGDGLIAAFDGLPRGGTWVFEICDFAPGFTGVVTGASLTISSASAGGLTYVVSQIPLGGPFPGLTRIEMTATGGVVAVPANFCLKVWTANLGNYPNGWFFGLDIAFNDLFIYQGIGWPFYHIFNVLGEADSYYDGVPVGLGATVYSVAVELDFFTFIPVHWSAPTALTLM